MSNQFCKFDGMIGNVAYIFRWSMTRLNIQNNYNTQCQSIWENLISTISCSPKTEPKVAQKSKEYH